MDEGFDGGLCLRWPSHSGDAQSQSRFSFAANRRIVFFRSVYLVSHLGGAGYDDRRRHRRKSSI